MKFQLPKLESIKNIDVTNKTSLTIIIILCLVIFTIIYIWLTKTYTTEGFGQYNINSADTVTLYGLDNILVGSTNPLSLTSTLNSLIDARNNNSLNSIYAKVSDVANLSMSISTNTAQVQALQSTINDVQTNITLVNQNLTSNVALMNANLTSAAASQSTALQSALASQSTALQTATASQTTALQTALASMATIKNNINTALSNTTVFVGSIAWRPISTQEYGGFTWPITGVYNLGKHFLEIFNWNNPNNVKNTNVEQQSLPSLLSNTTYIFHVSFSGWSGFGELRLICLDDRNGNTQSISNINDNNVRYSHNTHSGYTYHFKVTTSSTTPNIILGIISDAGREFVRNPADSASIVIYRLQTANALA
jgi:hypothetical protein